MKNFFLKLHNIRCSAESLHKSVRDQSQVISLGKYADCANLQKSGQLANYDTGKISTGRGSHCLVKITASTKHLQARLGGTDLGFWLANRKRHDALKPWYRVFVSSSFGATCSGRLCLWVQKNEWFHTQYSII